MSDERIGDGRADDGALDDEERTAVILPRLGRPEVADGLRKLGAAFGGFRRSMYEGADFIDGGTALGFPSLTPAEAEDIDELLEGIEHRVSGARRVLKRAIGPKPSEDP